MKRSQDGSSNSGSLIIQLKPVGIVKNQSKDPSWGASPADAGWTERASSMKEQSQSISEIIIDESLDGILDGIEDFSHIMVIYWAHLVPEERRSNKKVHPMGDKDFPLVGIFATRSPARPNPILTTVVRLVGRSGNVLKVSGLDALDGSPILDIKPYQPHNEPGDVRMPDWIKKINEKFADHHKSSG